MASAGTRKNRNGTRYQVWWRLDDGTQGSKTFDTRALARDFKNELLAQAAANSWIDPRRGRILFDEWADHWWRLWSASPRRSPKGMETTESHLRCHLRPYFSRRQLRQITPSLVLQWQHELEERLSHSGVMACRSILLRILEAARKERLIATNPVREWRRPGRASTRNRSLGISADGPSRPRSSGTYWPRVGPSTATTSWSRSGPGCAAASCWGCAAAGSCPSWRIEVIEVRYEAGRFGRGFKAEPKSLASVRVVPMCDRVREVIGRRLAGGGRPEDLVLPGPGGSNGIPRGARAPLSTNNLRRVYKAAVEATAGELAHLDLRGPHDLRHTFATWLEDAGVPSRVIDELMGHAGGRRDRGAGGSPMGRVYRETTPAMVARVTAALDDRIGRALAVAAYLLRERRESRAVDGGEGL